MTLLSMKQVGLALAPVLPSDALTGPPAEDCRPVRDLANAPVDCVPDCFPRDPRLKLRASRMI